MRYYLFLFFITSLVYASDREYFGANCSSFMHKLMQITEINTINREVSKYETFKIDPLPFFDDPRDLYFSMIPTIGQLYANEKKTYSNYPVKIQSIIRSIASHDKVNKLLSLFKKSKVLQKDPESVKLFEYLKKNKTTIIKSLKDRKIQDVLKVLYPEGIISFYDSYLLFSAKRITQLLMAVDPDLWGNILNKANISIKDNLKIIEELSTSGYSYVLNRLPDFKLRHIFVSILLRNINTEKINDQIDDLEATILKDKKYIQSLPKHISVKAEESLRPLEQLPSYFRDILKKASLRNLNIETTVNRVDDVESSILLETINLESLMDPYNLLKEEYLKTTKPFAYDFLIKKTLIDLIYMTGVVLYADPNNYSLYTELMIALDGFYSVLYFYLEDVDSLL